MFDKVLRHLTTASYSDSRPLTAPVDGISAVAAELSLLKQSLDRVDRLDQLDAGASTGRILVFSDGNGLHTPLWGALKSDGFVGFYLLVDFLKYPAGVRRQPERAQDLSRRGTGI